MDFLDEFLAPPPRAGGLQESSTSVNVMKGLPVKPLSDSLPLPSSQKSLLIPEDIEKDLFPHQREGIRWLYKKHCNARACLLADEMGLGKTIQVSTFLGLLYKTKEIKTTVIVVPVSLLGVWEDALRTWGKLDPKSLEVIHQDDKKKRTLRWKKLKYAACVFLTTYGVMKQDCSEISKTMLDYLVLDEAHMIKDSSTNAFNSASQLSAKHKIALTGTPLMNSFDDMWSLFNFLDGSIIQLEKSEFKMVSSTLLRGNEKDASEGVKSKAKEELEKLQALIRPFMLRREKKDLGISSEKRDSVVWIRMSDTQLSQYQAFLDTAEVKDVLTTDVSSNNPLVLLGSLSQICVHPWLNLTEAGFREAMRNPHKAPCEELGDIESSTKVGVIQELIDKALAEDRKILVFSRSKRFLHMLAFLLSERKINFTRFDGDISASERHQAVSSFNSDPSVKVCLLTTQVGGVGLTFSSASCVILADPSWNPSIDAQAVDRVHRIGQTRDVLVFRLITAGTVEEKVYRNQIFKRTAAKQISDGDASDLHRYFTHVELRSMFVLGQLDDSETACQLEELHPGCVSGPVTSFLAGVPGVVAVSDNSCILSADVRESNDQEEMSAPSSQPKATPRAKRQRSVSVSSGAPEVRHEKVEYDRAAEIRDMVETMECMTCSMPESKSFDETIDLPCASDITSSAGVVLDGTEDDCEPPYDLETKASTQLGGVAAFLDHPTQEDSSTSMEQYEDYNYNFDHNKCEENSRVADTDNMETNREIATNDIHPDYTDKENISQRIADDCRSSASFYSAVED